MVFLRDKFHVGYFIFAVLALEGNLKFCVAIAYREAFFVFGGMDL